MGLLMPQEQTENRRWDRYRFEGRVVWIHGQGSTVRGAIGRACDISEGGISVVLPAHIPIGNAAQLEFSIPGMKQPLRVQVVVRSCQGFRYGFEFRTLSLQQRQAIQRVCEREAVLTA